MFKKNKDILIALPAMGETFADAHGHGGCYLVAHLGLMLFQVFQWQYYQHLPGDFYRSGSCYFSVISKAWARKDQSKLAYHVTEAFKITLLLSALLGLSIFAGQEMIGLWELSRRWLRVVALPIFGGWIDCSLGLDDESRCLDSCNANPPTSHESVIQCLEYSFFKSAIFCP